MKPFGVVKPDKPVHFFKCLFKRLKAVPPQALPFQDAVERFNVRVFVRHLVRNALMFQVYLLTELVKRLAFELRPIVRPDHQRMALPMPIPLQQRLLHGFDHMPGVADLVHVIPDNLAVKHIDDAGHVKMPFQARHIAILDIQLPQLIGPGHHPVAGDRARHRLLDLPLGKQPPQLLAQPIHLFLADDQVVFLTQQLRQLPIAAGVVMVLKQPPDAGFDTGVRHTMPVSVTGVAGNRTAAAGGDPTLRVFATPVVRRARNIADLQHFLAG